MILNTITFLFNCQEKNKKIISILIIVRYFLFDFLKLKHIKNTLIIFFIKLILV